MAIGSLGANGDPTIEIEVLGAFNQPTKLACLIDTGFTGFLSIPLLQAFPIGLILTGTMSLQFANGASENRLTCLGVARLDGVENMGLIVIENEGNQVMLGMDFLKKFGFELLVCPTTGQIEMVPSASGFTVPAASTGLQAPVSPAQAPTAPTA